MPLLGGVHCAKQHAGVPVQDQSVSAVDVHDGWHPVHTLSVCIQEQVLRGDCNVDDSGLLVDLRRAEHIGCMYTEFLARYQRRPRVPLRPRPHPSERALQFSRHEVRSVLVLCSLPHACHLLLFCSTQGTLLDTKGSHHLTSGHSFFAG